MRRNIKITEEQYRMLQESSEDMFPYVTDSDAKPFNGYGDISADGKEEGEKNAEEKTTTDKIGRIRTPEYWHRFHAYGNVYPRYMREGVEINTADDFGEMDAPDNDKLENPNIVQIPNTVKQREQMLIDSTTNLTDMQKAVVLNNLLPHLTSDSTTYHQQKGTDNRLKNSKFPENIKKNLANNA